MGTQREANIPTATPTAKSEIAQMNDVKWRGPELLSVTEMPPFAEEFISSVPMSLKVIGKDVHCTRKRTAQGVATGTSRWRSGLCGARHGTCDGGVAEKGDIARLGPADVPRRVIQQQFAALTEAALDPQPAFLEHHLGDADGEHRPRATKPVALGPEIGLVGEDAASGVGQLPAQDAAEDASAKRLADL